MASKLLNVLNDIERGRQACIRAVKVHDMHISDNASLYEIANKLSLIPSDEKYLSAVGNTDPEQDPEIYHRPQGLPDIETIVKEAEIKVIHDDISNTDKTYRPFVLVLFKTLNTSDKFYVSSSLLEDSNSVRINSRLGNNNSYSCYTNLVILSDGTSFMLGGRNQYDEYIHTWDATKDLHDSEGNTYRYAFIYRCTQSGIYGMNFTKYNVQEIVQCQTGGYSPIYITCTHCKQFTELDNNYFAHNGFELIPNWVEKIIFKQAYAYNSTTLTDFDLTNSRALKYFDGGTKTKCSLSWPSGSNVGAEPVYVKCGCLSTAAKSNNSSSNHVKWLYVDPVEQKSIEVTSLWLPALLDSNIADCVKIGNLNSSYNYVRICVGLLLKNVIFESLEEYQGSVPLCESYKHTFSCPNLRTILNINAINGIPALVIDLPKLEAFPGNSSFTPNTMTQAILMPSLKDANKIVYWVNGATHLRYIDISGAVDTTGTLTISNSGTVEVVVLPQDFTFNVSIISSGLEHSCVLDIFRKAAILPEGTTRTITLSQNTKATLTAEEIAIATSKGWTVN